MVTVDLDDNPTGVMDKIDAHSNGGTLHRAFSIFVRDERGRILLQRRASTKYHFGGYWTNTCCGHALPEEDIAVTSAVRLWQEMGVCTALTAVAKFTYVAQDERSGLTEREIDYVFTGTFHGAPVPNSEEVAEWRWISPDDLQRELAEFPDTFTPWFGPALEAMSRSS